MASKKALIGTGIALTGLAGLAVAAVSVGAPDAATPLQPAADVVETQRQVVRTVEHRTKRLKAQPQADGRTVIRTAAPAATPAQGTHVALTTTTSTTAPAASSTSDDGPDHDAGDDHGGSNSGHGSDDGARSRDD